LPGGSITRSSPVSAPARRRPARLITLLAAGFLLLDAVLLGAVGWWDRRPGFLIAAAVLAAGAAGVVLLRRRYLAQLDEIARARAVLRQEAAELARALRERK
jgi:hypothetical protein